MNNSIQTLNDQFAIPGHVHFASGPDTIPTAVIENALCSGSMPVLGANVLDYTPRGQAPVLWRAPKDIFQTGLALHSGVPVCWPWFAANPSDPTLPMHGLVRTHIWSVSGTRALPDGSTEVRMTLQDNEVTRSFWPCAFSIEVTATFGKALDVAWEARNTGTKPFQYTGAFHPYFRVSDVSVVSVDGLDGVDYLDKTDAFLRKTQHGPITFPTWTDRIYLDTVSDLTIHDPGLERSIVISKQGSRTTVVWNPNFQEATIPALGPGGHKTFICVEPANAVNDVHTVAPGGADRLAMHVECRQGRS